MKPPISMKRFDCLQVKRAFLVHWLAERKTDLVNRNGSPKTKWIATPIVLF